MKRLFIITICFCLFQMASAMDEDTRRINAIKKDTTFLYADVTMRTQEEAMSRANEQLRQEIQDWNKNPHLTSHFSLIVTRRVEMYRVFVYISKDSLRLLPKEYKEGVIEQVKRAKTFFELKDIMEPLKQSGDIIDYGKYATMNNPEECYLVVYDVAGNILALLDKGSDERWNLTANKNDKTSNYRGCGAIWFIMK